MVCSFEYASKGLGRRRGLVLATAGWLVLSLLARPASAQFIEGVGIAEFSSELTSFDRVAAKTIDGSGFDEVTGLHSADPVNMWLNTGIFTEPNDPLPLTPGVDPNPFIAFDLGAVYDLSTISVWNYNEIPPPDGRILSTRGANEVRISAGLTLGSTVPLDNGADGDFTFAEAPGADDYAGEEFNLSGFSAAEGVRFVRIDFFSNHLGDNDFVGLSEVRFTGDAAPLLDGDVNVDGVVDLLDFEPILTNVFQNVATRGEGDLNGDGVVDFTDYREWKDVIDATNPGLAASISWNGLGVPEPASGLLALLGAVGCRLAARRRSIRFSA
ncbi:MAG: hypothetical protein AAF961_16260 [Planctomycetota bacterium]